ncbi:hypothetical protein SAMN04489806_1964 [Paramicrobacterium humi]|uniref:LTD domain-containing protein n=1 Tax=Paramicrobacterium humi TaxID=640635 RepID=A0A1H4MU01_9MICO|nr:ExeM/NucH family extracellular endonuclease [Microbacterium humi]SEB85852.1 hypothetical protein SAMN04489806_1964 [Microbacterium humi]
MARVPASMRGTLVRWAAVCHPTIKPGDSLTTARTHRKPLLAAAALLGLAAAPLIAAPALAAPDGTGVVINEAYLSGGSKGAAYQHKFVELFNPTDAAIALDGTSLQYRSASGTGKTSSTVALSGSIPAGGYFLVSGGSNGDAGDALENVNIIGSLNPSGTTGTIFLVDGSAAITPPVGDVAGSAGIVDALGYGGSNTFETALAPAPAGNTDVKSLTRTNAADTDDNSADFTLTADITPQGSGSETVGTPPDDSGDDDTPTGPGVEKTIAEIQGTTDTSPLVDKRVTTTGVVTAAYPDGGFNGYYIQTAGTGGAIDPTTHAASDGLFVFSAATVGAVAVGDHVQVTGKVTEFYGLTELSVASLADLTVLDQAAAMPTPVETEFPDTDAARESLEGMLVAPQGDFTVTDVYSANQYGEIGLAASDIPLLNPTVSGLPGTSAYDAEVARAEAEAVSLDDGSSFNLLSGPSADTPLPYLSLENPVRVGAAVTFTKPVVLDYRNDTWKFQPTSLLTGANADTVQPATFENTRTAAPESVGGDIRLGTFNVLNYFATTGDERTGCTYYTDRDGHPVTVRDSSAPGCGVRGAADAENLERQQDKIVAAINALDADVVSLEEIENSLAAGHDDRDYALGVLVDALNDAAGSDVWAFVPSPAQLPEGEDVIRTAFIYKPAVVETVGDAQILIGSAAFDNAREPDAQAFKPVDGSDDDVFVVVSNHFKSKGGGDEATGDNADLNDGRGAYNGDRTRQAEALLEFADAFAAEHDTDKVFLVGDFNSYAAEDPITTITAAGYVSQGAKTGEQTYNFDGAVGSLDYIFASPAADRTVTGADVWNINSVESVALEYSRYNYNATNLYAPDVYRASDHDPMLVGIEVSHDSGTPGHGHGKGHGKGHGHGNGHGNGHGSGHGNGHGNGKGHGYGHAGGWPLTDAACRRY